MNKMSPDEQRALVAAFKNLHGREMTAAEQRSFGIESSEEVVTTTTLQPGVKLRFQRQRRVN